MGLLCVLWVIRVVLSSLPVKFFCLQHKIHVLLTDVKTAVFVLNQDGVSDPKATTEDFVNKVNIHCIIILDILLSVGLSLVPSE